MHKIAQIGAGRMGQIHARNAADNPRLELVAIADGRSRTAARLAGGLNSRVASFAEILADRTIEGVIVATSTDAHLPQVLACLTAGKAVFCEKPLDLDLGRLRAHEAELTAPAARLFVAFQRRFDPHFRALHRRLIAGEIGRIESLHLISHDPAPPPPGFVPGSGGLFRDFSIHDFDVARWLLEDEPVRVFARAACLVDPSIGEAGDVDTARVLFQTMGGGLCVISNTRRSGYGYDQRIEAFGSRGRIAAENPRITAVAAVRETGTLDSAIHNAFPGRYMHAYRAEMDHFADILDGQASPETGYNECIWALMMAEAAAQSTKTGAMVRIEEI